MRPPTLPYKVQCHISRGIAMEPKVNTKFGTRIWNAEIRAQKEQNYIDNVLRKKHKIIKADLQSLLSPTSLITSVHGNRCLKLGELAKQASGTDIVQKHNSLSIYGELKPSKSNGVYPVDWCPRTSDDELAHSHDNASTMGALAITPRIRKKEGAIAFLLHCQTFHHREGDVLRIKCGVPLDGDAEGVEICTVEASPSIFQYGMVQMEIKESLDKLRWLISISLDSWLQLPPVIQATFYTDGYGPSMSDSDPDTGNGINWLHFSKTKRSIRARNSLVYTVGERKALKKPLYQACEEHSELHDSLREVYLRQRALRQHRDMRHVSVYSMTAGCQDISRTSWLKMTFEQKNVWKERRIVDRIKDRLFTDIQEIKTRLYTTSIEQSLRRRNRLDPDRLYEDLSFSQRMASNKKLA